MFQRFFTRKGVVYATIKEGVDHKFTKIESLESLHALAAESFNTNGQTSTNTTNKDNSAKPNEGERQNNVEIVNAGP